MLCWLPPRPNMFEHVTLCALLALAAASPVRAAEYAARSAAEVTGALSKVKPGDTIVLENGTWLDQAIEFAGHGKPDKPIVLRARTPGSVLLGGSSRLEISGTYLQVEGLRFEGGSLSKGDGIVQFRGRLGEASFSRLTDSAIIKYNPADKSKRYAWVALYGQNNRVDHNRFQGQNHSGVTVAVFRKTKKVDNHRIDNNYFVDRPPGDGNGYEAIRIGTSTSAQTVSATTVIRNLFERYDGEVETISVKSGGNVIRENTFREVAGTLTLRHGNGNKVEQNYFIGNHKPGTGGIRVTGENHVVRNNLLQDIEGRVGGVISLMCARDKPGPEVDYEPLRTLELRGNVVADSSAPALKVDAGCGSTRTVRPSGVTVAGNLVAGSKAPMVDGEPGSGWSWSENRFDGAGQERIPTNGVTRSAGLLSRDKNQVYRPAAQRGVGPTDPPLTPADVGPSWWKK
jgi:hypothetical protein